MGDTSIEWTDFSINPIRARLRDAAHAGLTKGGYGSGVGHFCEKISAGCALCYASTSQARFGMPIFPGVQKAAPAEQDVRTATVAVNDQVEVFFDFDRLEEVLRRKKPTKYFWCDQTDLFGRWVPDDWIDRCFAVMALTPWHTHQILTKRTERMAAWFNDPQPLSTRSDLVAGMAPRHVDGKPFTWGTTRPDQVKSDTYTRRPWPGWPLKNVWIGTSVEEQQAADERIPHLLKCPAAVRFLSAEPLLGPIDFRQQWVRDIDATPWNGVFDDRSTAIDGMTPIHWVIVGGESGHGARPCNVEWIRTVVGQCQAAGVPVFVKQLGSNPVRTVEGNDGLCKLPPERSDREIRFSAAKGGDPSEWPEDLRVRQFPEVASA